MKIVFLCGFSNETVRKRLHLKNWSVENWFRGLFGLRIVNYSDSAPWVTSIISVFEKHHEHEFHVVAPQDGMTRRREDFTLSGIHYHFVNLRLPNIKRIINKFTGFEEKSYYKENRRKINNIINEINPDLVTLCGAEVVSHSSAALDIQGKPIFVILQTVLNNPNLQRFYPCSPIRLEIERQIFRKTNYFGCTGQLYKDLLLSINPEANVFRVNLPMIPPPSMPIIEKEYDFVFYAASVVKYKGIEDLVHAFSIVIKTIPNATLNIIGGCSDEYRSYLCDILREGKALDNVVFSGFFPNHNDVYKQIIKSRCVVVPGITAIINSTVVEPLFMGLPVITYVTSGTPELNSEKECVLLAESENVVDLADKMMWAYNHPQEMATMAKNGKEMVEKRYSVEFATRKIIKCMEVVEQDYNKVNAFSQDIKNIAG